MCKLNLVFLQYCFGELSCVSFSVAAQLCSSIRCDMVWCVLQYGASAKSAEVLHVSSSDGTADAT